MAQPGLPLWIRASPDDPRIIYKVDILPEDIYPFRYQACGDVWRHGGRSEHGCRSHTTLYLCADGFFALAHAERSVPPAYVILMPPCRGSETFLRRLRDEEEEKTSLTAAFRALAPREQEQQQDVPTSTHFNSTSESADGVFGGNSMATDGETEEIGLKRKAAPREGGDMGSAMAKKPRAEYKAAD
ncbi:hypothetical protein LTR85_009885 [Meristemomyces frigidus]|nr:hypothetical protein LTR85_009885 [Meristemomyces frigidus]